MVNGGGVPDMDGFYAKMKEQGEFQAKLELKIAELKVLQKEERDKLLLADNKIDWKKNELGELMEQ